MSRRTPLAAPLLFVLATTVLATTVRAQEAPNLGTDDQRAEGKALYSKYCAQCHGEQGDGVGHATPLLKPEPRNFTSGTYKFRTTPSGKLPTDADLRRVIELGLPYTSMPGWPDLTASQVQNLIYHLKTFSTAFTEPDRQGEPLEIPKPPESTEETVTRGRQVYLDQGCAACHGDLGRGNGTSAPTLQDDWGKHIRAADLTQRWTFRGGPTREDIFRTFSTGHNGTTMPSYADVLPVEDRWHLVNYIVSLGDGDAPGYGTLVVARFVDEEIDLANPAALFASARKTRFPLLGQIVEPGRNFTPGASSIEVKAIYNRREIAFELRWNDMSEERGGIADPTLAVPEGAEDGSAAEPAGDDFFGGLEGGGQEEEADDSFFGDAEAGAAADDFFGEAGSPSAAGGSEFADGVAIQLPSSLPAGNRKPYFIFGDASNPVDLWFVSLARADLVQQFLGRGSDQLERSDADTFATTASYDHGEWTVVIKRAVRSTTNVSFTENQFVPVSFSVWDGWNRERGNKRALSAWFYVYPEPVRQASAKGPMARAAGLALIAELVVVFLIRRRHRGTAGAALPAAASGS